MPRDTTAGVNLQRLAARLGRHKETIKAVAVYAGIPHVRIGMAVLFSGSAVPALESALAEYDARAASLRRRSESIVADALDAA